MSESEPYLFPAGITSGSPELDRQIYVVFVAKYQGDPDYRKWADADPAGALRAEGLHVPEGIEVKLLCSTDDAMHVVLPADRQD